jgi:hypothetical protein
VWLGSHQLPRGPGWTNLLRNYTYARPASVLARDRRLSARLRPPPGLSWAATMASTGRLVLTGRDRAEPGAATIPLLVAPAGSALSQWRPSARQHRAASACQPACAFAHKESSRPPRSGRVVRHGSAWGWGQRVFMLSRSRCVPGELMPSYIEHGGGRRVSARIRRDREVSRVLDRRASDGRMGSSAVTGSCPGRSRIAMGNAGSDYGHPA